MTSAAFGACDEYANALREAFGVSLHNETAANGADAITIEGSECRVGISVSKGIARQGGRADTANGGIRYLFGKGR